MRGSRGTGFLAAWFQTHRRPRKRAADSAALGFFESVRAGRGNFACGKIGRFATEFDNPEGLGKFTLENHAAVRLGSSDRGRCSVVCPRRGGVAPLAEYNDAIRTGRGAGRARGADLPPLRRKSEGFSVSPKAKLILTIRWIGKITSAPLRGTADANYGVPTDLPSLFLLPIPYCLLPIAYCLFPIPPTKKRANIR